MTAARRRAAPPIFVEILIRTDLDTLWRLTQDTDAHPRWDVRFSRITTVASLSGGGSRFRYERRIPLHSIVGTGTTIGEIDRPDGTRTSALRFSTADPWSPLGDGRGYWRYTPTPEGVLFATGYDYAPGWGALVDRLLIRRLVGWATAWSFDRLRLWAETGTPPERWPLASALAFWSPGRPRAGRCARHRARVMETAPATLDELAAP